MQQVELNFCYLEEFGQVSPQASELSKEKGVVLCFDMACAVRSTKPWFSVWLKVFGGWDWWHHRKLLPAESEMMPGWVVKERQVKSTWKKKTLRQFSRIIKKLWKAEMKHSTVACQYVCLEVTIALEEHYPSVGSFMNKHEVMIE